MSRHPAPSADRPELVAFTITTCISSPVNVSVLRVHRPFIAAVMLVLLAAPACAAAQAIQSPAAPATVGPRSAVRGATPTLNLTSLEERLTDTPALGVFTKLSLKNQVDDLLGDFRSFYSGRSRVSLAELRQKFELLLFKSGFLPTGCR
jgi:hypothetical protein